MALRAATTRVKCVKRGSAARTSENEPQPPCKLLPSVPWDRVQATLEQSDPWDPVPLGTHSPLRPWDHTSVHGIQFPWNHIPLTIRGIHVVLRTKCSKDTLSAHARVPGSGGGCAADPVSALSAVAGGLRSSSQQVPGAAAPHNHHTSPASYFQMPDGHQWIWAASSASTRLQRRRTFNDTTLHTCAHTDDSSLHTCAHTDVHAPTFSAPLRVSILRRGACRSAR